MSNTVTITNGIVVVKDSISNSVVVSTAGAQGPQGLQGPPGTPGASGSVVNTSSLATTGSNSFIGTQTITGSVYVAQSDSGEPRVYIGDSASIGLGMGTLSIVDSSGYLSLYTNNNASSTMLSLNSYGPNFLSIQDTDSNIGVNPVISFSKNGSLDIWSESAGAYTASLLVNHVPYDAHLATTGSNSFDGNQAVTGSLSITGIFTVGIAAELPLEVPPTTPAGTIMAVANNIVDAPPTILYYFDGESWVNLTPIT